MIPTDVLNRIEQMLDEDKVRIDVSGQLDIFKHGNPSEWTMSFIKNCLREGKKYEGKELYPDDPNRSSRYYCMHNPYILSRKVILIGFLLLQDILIIHICSQNPGSKEGKVYYSKS